MCVTWLIYTRFFQQWTRLIHTCNAPIHMFDIAHSYVWHASFMCVTCLIHDLSHSCASRYPFIYASFRWLIFLIHVCDMTHSYAWYDSLHLLCNMCHVHTCDMTYTCDMTLLQVWGDTAVCVTWRIHVMRVTWPMHMCDMTLCDMTQ